MTTKWDIDAPWFDRLETEYRMFREYAGELRRAIEALDDDPLLYRKVQLYWQQMEKATVSEARALPVPETEDPRLAPWIRVILLLPFVPSMMDAYRKHGYPETEVREMFQEFYVCIQKTEQRSGIRGLTDMYFGWVILFFKEFFLHVEDFTFEMSKHAQDAVYFRRRGGSGQSAEYAVLAVSGRWHRDGFPLGSAGYTDEEGSFEASFREDSMTWSGNLVEAGLVRPVRRTLLKSEWVRAVGKGDPVLKLHINPGADLREEHVAAVVDRAKKLASERLGPFKGVTCGSWLLDPAYRKMLGEDSKIAGFGEQFLRIALPSSGKEIFTFVFGYEPEDLHELPETTHLTRALKELYLSGGSTHAFGGIYIAGSTDEGEEWDLFTKDREPAGLTMHYGEKEPEGCFRMLVQIAVFNKRGQMLIQKRKADKDTWPGRWDISAGGCVSSGETSYEGAMRETEEEIGVRIDLPDCPHFTIWKEHTFNDFYVTRTDLPLTAFTPQKEEVDALAFASKEEIFAMIDAEQFVPYVPAIIDLLWEYSSSRGTERTI